MSLSDVDCMTCLTNVARGLEVINDWRVRRAGVTHAVVWEMGSGRATAACGYERHDPYGIGVGWRRRS